MSRDELFERFLLAYSTYYNVNSGNVRGPFDAEAVFEATQEQYFLLKSAKISEIFSNEFVFFAKRDHLTWKELKELDTLAWERGMERVAPGPNHRNSDVTLIVVTESLDEDIPKGVRKLKHSKSYRFGLWGYSSYKLAVTESSTGKTCYNGQGDSLKKLVADIYQSKLFQKKERKK